MLRRVALALLLLCSVSVAASLSCHDSVSLPPVKGPPLAVPEARGGGVVVRETTPLSVVHVSPVGQLDSPHLQVTVSFSRPMVALDAVEEQRRKAPLSIEPTVAGEVQWLGTRTAVFHPKEPLSGSTTYTVTVPAGVKAVDGSALARAKTFKFATPRLTVARVSPGSGTRWRTPDTRPELFFNQPVSPEQVQQHLTLRAATGSVSDPAAGPVPVTVVRGKDARRVEVRPQRPLPLDARITLSIDENLTGSEGPLPMGKPFETQFFTYGPFKVTGLSCTNTCDPEDGLRISFSNPAPADKLFRAIRVAGKRLPGKPGKYLTSSIYFTPPGGKPRATYRVTVVPAGLKDRFGQPLQPPKALAFSTGDLRPLAYFPLQSGVIEPQPSMRMRLLFRNARQAELFMLPMGPAEVAGLLGHPDYWGADEPLLPRVGKATTVKVKATGPANKKVVQRVDLAPHLSRAAGVKGPAVRGILAVELRATLNDGGSGDTTLRRAVLRVTDLGLHAKIAPHATLLWVTRLSDGQPVPDAAVSLWRKGESKPLWEGTTDAAGLARGPGATTLGASTDDYNFLFFATKGEDTTYVASDTRHGISPWDFGLDATWDDGSTSVMGVVFTDRGLFRPGEKVYVKGILRREGEKGLTTPADEPVSVTVSDARGEELLKRELKLSAFGSFAMEVDLPAGAPLGGYSVTVRPRKGGSAHGSFRVEEYRPAEFKVGVTAEERAVVRGATVGWTVDAQYLFGAPMRGSETAWNIYRSPAYFEPPGWEGFSFEDSIGWWEEGRTARSGGFESRGSGSLDQGGQYQQSTRLAPPPRSGPQRYQIEATVTDISRQAISARTGVLVHPGPYYIGARPEETFVSAGDPLKVEVIAAAPGGKAKAGVALTGTLVRREWVSVRKQGMGGSHTFVTRRRDTQVGTCKVRTAAKPRPCQVKVPEAGYYIMTFAPDDPKLRPHVATSFSAYASGSDYVAWKRDSEDRVELVPDRKVYNVGQVARILVKSPFAKARGLMTVERNGIYEQRPFELTRTAHWLNVPITRHMQPNVFVGVTLVRGRVGAPSSDKDKSNKEGRGAGSATEEDPGRPTFKVGYIKLDVNQDDRRLKVRVAPQKQDYRPGEEVTVDLSVTDHKGKPVAAELTVMAADEGVLSLIGYKAPDPMAVFYAARGLSVRTADNRLSLLSPRVFGEKGNNPGGGGAEMGAAAEGGVRRNFVSTPYFNPSVVTGKDGKAQVAFKLPDNLTTFRIMAVGASAGAEFGASSGKVRVNKPLLLLHSLPRLLRVGDRMLAGVVVHNRSGRAGDVQVSASVRGAVLTGEGAATLALAKDQSKEARFAFEAQTSGSAVFTFRARLGDYEDALELTRPVKLPLVMETVTASGSTERAVAEGVTPSGAGVRADAGGLEVTMASTAMVGLKAGMDYLMAYPYECLEQSTSRLVPLVMLGDLRRAFGLGATAGLDEHLARIIARIEKLQRWNGGFAYWPSSPRDYAWASAYAAWGLGAAKSAGQKVSDRVLEKAKSYLKQQLRESTGALGGDALAVELATRAHIVYALATLGEVEHGHLSKLYEQRNAMPVFGRALLLSALSRGKADQQMVRTMVDELAGKVHQTARAAKVEENLTDAYAPLFHSSTRSTAMVLDALLSARPDHPLVEKLTRWLLDERKDGRWGNTQENAYALMAIHRYFTVREKEEPDFVARVLLGDEEVVREAFQGRSLEAKSKTIPMKALLASGGGTLGFVKDGAGRLYYTATLRYARKDLPEQPLDAGFFVERRYEVVDRAASSMSDLRGKQAGGAPDRGVTQVKAGDMVRVTLKVTVPQQMHFVAVDDPLPAGLEAVNMKLMTASQDAQRRFSSYSYRSRYGARPGYRSMWHTPFYQQELRDDRALLFADAVPPGVYTYVYLARATTAGTFVAPPTHVEQMYAPETFGRTGAVRFEVQP